MRSIATPHSVTLLFLLLLICIDFSAIIYIPTIVVPDFAQSYVKAFYIEYSNHLLKCIKAIREKDEAKVINLFKNPGEALVKRSRIIEKEVIMNSVEKQKWMQYAAQVYPYIKELEASVYYQKLYGKE